MFEIVSSMDTMSASSSSVQRPVAKRAAHTWPIPAMTRNHFEDFLKEIGATTEACHLCCIPRQGSPTHHSHERKASASAKARVSGSASRTRQLDHRDHGASASHERPRPVLGSTPSPSSTSSPPRNRVPSLPIAVPLVLSGHPSRSKSGPLSALNTQNCEALRPPSRLFSAQESLRSLLGDIPDDEPPPRASAQAHDTNTLSHNGITESVTANYDVVTSSAPSTRSMSRTPSSDSLSTASSSEAPATPRTHTSLLPEIRLTLADLENTSRFRVQAICTACRKTGANFPSCTKCGETWCSRECRLKGSGGRRHVCARSAALATG
ncbi:hypothetical protein B0H21DRAFT_505927 [Amylocystis lapponica]|nr:hypothetical protein B0H21DRAFT_505927 [Amylocystis lapponica]